MMTPTDLQIHIMIYKNADIDHDELKITKPTDTQEITSDSTPEESPPGWPKEIGCILKTTHDQQGGWYRPSGWGSEFKEELLKADGLLPKR